MLKPKILFLGLDNSGKTSIVLSLQKDKNLLDYVSLEPTKEIVRTKLVNENDEFAIWDFGGQEIYRENHIENLNTYLTGATKINYVIDIQDERRYDLSLQYFEEILKVLEKEMISIKFSIFLHKFDPNLVIKEEIVSDLINKIIEMIPSGSDYNLFKTSIFTVFRKITII